MSFLTGLSNTPTSQLWQRHEQGTIEEAVAKMRAILGPRRPSRADGYAVAYVYGERVAIPCLLDRYAPHAVFLMTDRRMASDLGFAGAQFMLGSMQGFGALAAQNIAAAYRPEGL